MLSALNELSWSWRSATSSGAIAMVLPFGSSVEGAVGGGDRGADFFPGRVGGEAVGPHHPHEGPADQAAVAVAAVDRGHQRPGVDDVGAAGQRVDADLRQAPDPPPVARARRFPPQRADHADRSRRRPVDRVPEVADQVHRLGLVGLVRRELQGTGGGGDAAVAADDPEVGGLDRGATDEPVEGDRDVVEPLRPAGQPTALSVPHEALRIRGLGRASEPALAAAGSAQARSATPSTAKAYPRKRRARELQGRASPAA